jgi:hypothetical protein
LKQILDDVDKDPPRTRLPDEIQGKWKFTRNDQMKNHTDKEAALAFRIYAFAV